MAYATAETVKTLLFMYSERDFLAKLLQSWPEGEAKQRFQDCVRRLQVVEERIAAVEGGKRSETIGPD